MKDDTPPRQQLRTLLAAASDGELSPGQREQLTLLLQGQHYLVSEYMALVSVDYLLRQEPVQRYLEVLIDSTENRFSVPLPAKVRAEKIPSSGAKLSPSKPLSKDWTSLWSQFSRKTLAWSGALAVLLLVSAAVWPLLKPPSALIFENKDALWGDALARENGAALGDQWVTLATGSSKIAFRRGTTMTVEGPATFRILSADSCELKEGSLSAYVPEEAIGFRVALADANIVDLGTAFRVDKELEGKTRVYVSAGKVRVEPQNADNALTLQSGQIVEWSDSAPLQLSSSKNFVPTTSGKMVFDTYQPPSLGYAQYRHDDKIFVFLERPETVLQHDLRVDVMLTGAHVNFTSSQGTIPKGTRVRSYLVHFSPVQKRRILSGAAVFPEPILGVICDSDRLNATNTTLGTNMLLRCFHNERGIESYPDFNSDRISISSDRKRLSAKFSTESIDQFRVITAVGP